MGGKTRFGPWLQLLEAYADKHSGYRPIAYLALGDSVDTATDLTRAYREAQLSVPTELDREGRALSSAFAMREMTTGLTHTHEYNRTAEVAGVGLALLPIDLEFAILENARNDTVGRLNQILGLSAANRDELMTTLGSKAHRTSGKEGGKGDWMRAEMAKILPWGEVSESLRGILRRWLNPLLEDTGTPVPKELTAALAKH